MSSRYVREQTEVASYLPPNTRHECIDGRDVWIFCKKTTLGVDFEIAIYYDFEESPPGYCAQLVSPVIETSWMSPHVGHIFKDGVICLGGESMRTRRTLRESYAKSCLWAEGISVMITSKLIGRPTHFPFSKNNTSDEA